MSKDPALHGNSRVVARLSRGPSAQHHVEHAEEAHCGVERVLPSSTLTEAGEDHVAKGIGQGNVRIPGPADECTCLRRPAADGALSAAYALEAHAEVSTELRRIALGHRRTAPHQKLGQGSVKWPDGERFALAPPLWLKLVSPAGECALAHLVGAKRPEERAGSATLLGGTLAPAVQLIPREAEPICQVLKPSSAGPVRVEGSVKVDLLLVPGDLEEVLPGAGAAELLEGGGERRDPHLVRVCTGQADGKVEADENRRCGLGAKHPVEQGSGRR